MNRRFMAEAAAAALMPWRAARKISRLEADMTILMEAMVAEYLRRHPEKRRPPLRLVK